MSDISSLLGGYGVSLEQKALNQFGAAVGDYSNQAGLGPLSDIATQSIRNKGLTTTTLGGLASAFGVQSLDGLLGSNGGWQSSKYAADLVQYAPKHRFIFKVKFIFNDPYANHINREFMYVVKEIDKPKVVFEYEDVNMYNFKTKVLKAIKHEALAMSFHDDIQNKVLDFFNAYRVAYSPVSSLTYEQIDMMEVAGMDFYAPGSGGLSSASMGILANGQKNILNHIEVSQVYGHGTRENVFIFTNPRIENFDFDNLSHDGSDGSSLSVNFNYDALYVYDTATSGTPSPAWGATDILGNSEGGEAKSQFGNMLMGDDSIGSYVNSAISSVTDALSTPISAITSAFGEVSGAVKGVISSATSEISEIKKSIASALPKINQSTAGIVNEKAVDSSGALLDNASTPTPTTSFIAGDAFDTTA